MIKHSGNFSKAIGLVALGLACISASAMNVWNGTIVTADPSKGFSPACGRNGTEICRPLILMEYSYRRVLLNGPTGSFESIAIPVDFSGSSSSADGATWAKSTTHYDIQGWAARGAKVSFASSPNTSGPPVYVADTELLGFLTATRTDTRVTHSHDQTITDVDVSGPYIEGERQRWWACPDGYDGGVVDNRISYCKLRANVAAHHSNGCYKNGAFCGDPINVGSGNASASYSDLRLGNRGIDFAVAYNSRSVGSTDGRDFGARSRIGAGWSHSLGSFIEFNGLTNTAEAFRDNSNQTIFFDQTGGGVFLADLGTNDVLQRSVDGSNKTSGWLYRDMNRGALELYDAQGRMTSRHFVDGRTVSLSYQDGLLAKVQDDFGRSLSIVHQIGTERPVQLVATISDSAGGQYQYAYDNHDNLTAITFPDGVSRKFSYGDALSIPNFQTYVTGTHQLTGVIDELGAKFEVFGYSSDGSASFNELAGGVAQYRITYSNSTSVGGAITAAEVVDPLGAHTQYPFTVVQGRPYPTEETLYSSTGAQLATKATRYDRNGNAKASVDFASNLTCTSSDPGRNLETVRVEGLSQSSSCDTYTAAGATLPAGSRKVSTSWHPDWRLETRRAEPGRITISVYNGQPDPLNSNAVANCAPSSAVLPDGKPIVVLCKRVEQATIDADGHLGFSAGLQGGVFGRAQTWTYNQYGQVLTSTDPLNHTTSYTYYADTSFTGTGSNAMGHTLGDLKTLTNAAGKVTTYTLYNKYGQMLQSSDPNGVVTTKSYDLRQRLLSTSVAGRTTRNAYDAAGQLVRTTGADGSWVGYEYDAAHRQTAVLDNLGNRIEYTLDNAGNRIAQSVKDPTGALARTASHSLDIRGRVLQTTGRE